VKGKGSAVSDVAVRVTNLGKRFRIGTREPYLRFSELPRRLCSAAARRLRGRNGSDRAGGEDLWALKDVSFEVKRGEVVGIIGRNGAGKSTLLKILSRITRPTEGEVELHGRVGSLLEVGTGFHPELTGRENIYLNGTILGMRKWEIDRKFDEIVAFSEIERFLDTAVKHYSSGMYMRLAFAVAAHLEPEILVVDEVLAVGDAQFQKKCLGKMAEVARGGRTVLLVSHNMGAINRFCHKAILLQRGEMAFAGPVSIGLQRYAELAEPVNRVPIASRRNRDGDGSIRLVNVHWEDSHCQPTPILQSGGDYRYLLEYVCPDGLPKRRVTCALLLKDAIGTPVLHHQSDFSGDDFEQIPPRGRFVCVVPQLPVAPGHYLINLHVGIGQTACDSIADADEIDIEFGDFYRTGQPPRPDICRTLVKCSWKLEE
jgi:lipopolysaccharide transport system ATP-binding protein